MQNLLQKITQDYIDDRLDNEILLANLNNLDYRQLQIVSERIKEVEEKYGNCKLRRVNLESLCLSINTDHPEDRGTTVDLRPYKAN